MGERHLSRSARVTSAAIALAALAAQAMQTFVDLGEGMTFVQALWHQGLYFTNIMTWMVMFVFGWQTLTGRVDGDGFIAAIALWDAFVGIVYHVLLAASHAPTGLDVTVNLLHHSIVPIMVFGFWVALAPKAGLTFRNPFLWLLFPNGYAIYGMLRGLTGGTYPYFFLNLVDIGWTAVAIYLLALNLAFLIAGLLMCGGAKAGRRLA